MWMIMKMHTTHAVTIAVLLSVCLCGLAKPGAAEGHVSCPYGWTSFPTGCGIIVKERHTWFDAQLICQALGANLARIDSDEMNQNFMSLLIRQGVSEAWIGLTDLAVEGHFTWAGSQESAEYRSFEPGEPNNRGGKEDCVEILSDGRWNDETCTDGLMFLCETSMTNTARNQ